MASKIAAEIARARKRPMDDAKMTEFLTKLRKDATGTLSFAKLVQVLDRLGWAIAPVMGWTPRHYEYQGKEQLVVADTNRTVDKTGLEELHARLVAAAADELPEVPSKVGEVVIMNIGPIKEGATYGTTTIFYFYRREFVGTEGVTVTSPDGQEATFLPDHHDLDRGKTLTDDSLASHDVWRGLKTMGIMDSVNGALGTEAHVARASRTRDNTGTCPACWGNYKLDRNARLVLHGYQRPGYGFIQGSCICEGAPPLETSFEGAATYRELLQRHLASARKRLASLESGDVNEILGRRGQVVARRGDPSFDHSLRQEIASTTRSIENLQGDVDLYDKLEKAWRERPLPKEGELERGPGFFLK